MKHSDRPTHFSALETCFASPLRDNWETLYQQAQLIESNEESVQIYNCIPDPMLILNQQRQTVFANETALNLFNIKFQADYLGQRPGELLKCCHSTELPAGCGCSESCCVCGAVRAILQAQEGNASSQDCRISTQNKEALDLRVHARPITVKSQAFILFIAHDISSEKRRSALERIFFHDITNTANILRSYQEMIAKGLPEESEGRFKNIACLLTDRLMDEIESHRILLSAERRELCVCTRELLLQDIFDQIDALYSPLSDQRGIPVINASEHKQLSIKTDPVLALRVLGNMIKNAVEASDTGQSVTLSTELMDEHLLFHVHNTCYIPKSVSLQIFTRSFSTKGKGRGIGTYSMRLLAEKYLNGHVYFTSNEQEGTTFTFEIPLDS